jgi:hypothetical protein
MDHEVASSLADVVEPKPESPAVKAGILSDDVITNVNGQPVKDVSNIWACDFFCVRTILFQTLYVFFAVRHVNREILHIAVTPYPTAEWTAQQLVECCARDPHHVF